MENKLGIPNVLTAVAVYRLEDYPRLLTIADDASGLEPTWQEWHQVFYETRQMMIEQGIALVEMTVDLDALEQYCQEKGLRNTSSTRAEYVARLLSDQHQQFIKWQSSAPLKLRAKHKKRKRH